MTHAGRCARQENCQIAATSKVVKFRHRYTRPSNQKIESPVAGFRLSRFSNLAPTLLLRFFFFFFLQWRSKRVRVSLFLSSSPVSLFLLFFSISDCTTRIVRVVTREEVEWVLVHEYVSAFVPRLERPHNGDTCQNNWHTGVSNLLRNRWRTSTSKESWSCVTASRPLSMNFRRPFGRQRIVELLRTRICIRQMFLLSRVRYSSAFFFRRTTTRK